MVTCASGNSSFTACASRCAVECRRISTPSGSRSVTMATSASASMRWLVSTSLPFTFPASAARARPAPIELAISATVTGPGNDFDEPSGRRILGIALEDAYYHGDCSSQPRDQRLRSRARSAPAGHRAPGSRSADRGDFFRFTKFREWDASEMSFGKAVSLLSEERPNIVAIPVFPSRVFRHSAIYLGRNSSIRKPKDLEGKRVGIPEWAQTAGIYVRGLLQHEYGVDLAAIDWRQAGVREPGRIEKVELKLPEGVKIAAMPERSLSEMLAAGDLDAVISARDPGGERLFADYQQIEADYFRKTRIYPIMHVVVLRKPVYERDRWIAMNLLKAFEEAKRGSLARIADIGVSHVPVPWIAEQVRRWRALAGEDFWPYGVEPNRPTLEAFLQYAFEQGVGRKRLAVEDLFARETLESFKI